MALCPVVITPRHLVVESRIEPEPLKGRQTASDIANLHVLSGLLLRGWLLTQTMGFSYAARLAFDVFRPGSKLLKIKQLSEVNSRTRLH